MRQPGQTVPAKINTTACGGQKREAAGGGGTNETVRK
jgi:hypothetical protein